MLYNIEKKAIKDIKNLPVTVQKKLKSIFIIIDSITSLDELANCRKLKGNVDYYRIKFSSYRIGFKLENETLKIYRVLHRKNIYKKFP